MTKPSVISVFIISAPSGSGKSTLVNRLLKTVPNLAFSISYTTRPRRPAEVEGVDYIFISRKDFEARLGRGEFLEHAEVFGNYYGTNREAFESATREGKDLVLDIDIQGARQLRTAIPQATTIFVLPPSKQVMEQRLRSRSQDSEEVIQRRLQGAAAEVKNYTHYDYVLINRNIDEASAQLVNIVEAERLRRTRMEEEVRPILASFIEPDGDIKKD
ncbi:MAG TPA: guanylate kinase [Bryobacteraceae bacterium]|nr:guanylate kinase [Bryobacteraceae bacterium]